MSPKGFPSKRNRGGPWTSAFEGPPELGFLRAWGQQQVSEKGQACLSPHSSPFLLHPHLPCSAFTFPLNTMASVGCAHLPHAWRARASPHSIPSPFPWAGTSTPTLRARGPTLSEAK